MFKEYADKYGVSLADAISDRDWPMSLNECIKAFHNEAGRLPTDQEVFNMRPDGHAITTAERLYHDMEALGWYAQH